jgi:hypothetical protein
LNTLKFAHKGELFKIVEGGKLQRELMRQSSGLEKAEYAKKKEDLSMYIKKAPKLPIGYILERGPVRLTAKQIEKFKQIYLINSNRNAAKPLMGNIGCGFNADYCLSFYHKEDRVDYVFCFSCNLYKVYINRVYQDKINFFIYSEDEFKDLIHLIMSNHQ